MTTESMVTQDDRDCRTELERHLHVSHAGPFLTDDALDVLAAHRTAAQPEREAALEEAAKFVEQWNGDTRDGDTFLIAEELRALKATPAPVSKDEIVAVLEAGDKLADVARRYGGAPGREAIAAWKAAILARLGEGE